MKLIMKYCKRTIKRYPWVFLRAMALIVFITLLNALVPYGMRVFLEKIVPENNYTFIMLGVVAFGVYLTFKTFADIRWYILLDELGGKCITDLTVETETALAEASQADVDAIGGEKIKHSLYADVLDVFRVIGHHIPSMLGSVAVIVASLILAAFYDVKMTLFIFVALVLGVFLSMASRNMIARRAGQTNVKLKEHHAICNQYMDSLPLVQTNPVHSYFTDKTKNGISDFIKTSQKEDKVNVFWTETVGNYNTLFTLVLSALLALPAAGGSIVNLVFFISLSDIIMAEGQKMEKLIQQIVRSNCSFENIDRLLKLPKRQGDVTLGQIREITLGKVSFSYLGNDENVLLNMSQTLHAGDNIRLVGSNGSGKSTFIKLLTGVYAPKEGSICMNGRPLKDYSLESLHEQILYINQDETLLNESIKKYLEIMGEQELKDEQVLEMLENVSFEGAQFDREITGNGLSLSVGQRKKLLILKLKMRFEKASLIILDEIEAGLDLETRRKYVEFLQKLFADREKIVLVIEHDMNENLKFDKEIRF